MRDGKMWSPDDYETSTRGMATLALRWAEKMREAPASYKSMSVWDNTVFPAQEVSLDRFVELSACGHAEALAKELEARPHGSQRSRPLKKCMACEASKKVSVSTAQPTKNRTLAW